MVSKICEPVCCRKRQSYATQCFEVERVFIRGGHWAASVSMNPYIRVYPCFSISVYPFIRIRFLAFFKDNAPLKNAIVILILLIEYFQLKCKN
jgi:hypothetical protein